MNPKTQNLGRGISSLIDEEKKIVLSKSKRNIQDIPIENIQPGPWQARKKFEEEELNDLAKSINSKGVINPILLMPKNKKIKALGYYLIAGERRWRACQLVKKHEIPLHLLLFSPWGTKDAFWSPKWSPKMEILLFPRFLPKK